MPIRRWLIELPERPKLKVSEKLEVLRRATRNFRAAHFGRRTRRLEVDSGYVVLPTRPEKTYRYEDLGTKRTPRQCSFCRNQATVRRFSLDKDNEVIDKSSRVFVCENHKSGNAGAEQGTEPVVAALAS